MADDDRRAEIEARMFRSQFYRYEVAPVVQRRTPRAMLNRYGWKVIGVAVVVGRHAYCLKWSHAR